jgi:hypothetical protein
MTTAICVECKQATITDKMTCTNCGAPLAEQPQGQQAKPASRGGKRSVMIAIAAAVIGFGAASIFFHHTPDSSDTANDGNANTNTIDQSSAHVQYSREEIQQYSDFCAQVLAQAYKFSNFDSQINDAAERTAQTNDLRVLTDSYTRISDEMKSIEPIHVPALTNQVALQKASNALEHLKYLGHAHEDIAQLLMKRFSSKINNQELEDGATKIGDHKRITLRFVLADLLLGYDNYGVKRTDIDDKTLALKPDANP